MYPSVTHSLTIVLAYFLFYLTMAIQLHLLCIEWGTRKNVEEKERKQLLGYEEYYLLG
jgi:hypothetical protein